MEHKLGEIFEHNGAWYQCIVGNDCKNCAFNEKKCYAIVDNGDPIGECCADRRQDNKDVIFKKLEKVGEPFIYNYKNERLVKMQEYKLFDLNFCKETDALMIVNDYNLKRISIELKQNKEDMEEKKLNLKPFDIQKAREGKPVCTRDGRKARIVCFDVKVKKPIAALITNDDTEEIHFYYDNGRSDQYQEYRYDLMMLPEKRSGWAKVRKDINLYDTKEEADRKMIGNDEYVTAKVCWEE